MGLWVGRSEQPAQRIAARDHARRSARCRYLVAPVAEALIDFGTVNRGSGP